MFIVAIHWRIKPNCVEQFRLHWREKNTIADKSHLVHEFLSEALPSSDRKYTTWHLDSESLGVYKSFVTVGIWDDSGESFAEQVAIYFNDDNPIEDFEFYRRRRVAFDPVEWRIGTAHAPSDSSNGVI